MFDVEELLRVLRAGVCPWQLGLVELSGVLVGLLRAAGGDAPEAMVWRIAANSYVDQTELAGEW